MLLQVKAIGFFLVGVVLVHCKDVLEAQFLCGFRTNL